MSLSHQSDAASARADARLDHGVRIICVGGGARRGDPIEAYVGDELLGSAPLRRERGGVLPAHLALDAPELRFPALLRVMNGRTGDEIGTGLPIADLDALLRAAGPPRISVSFAGLLPQGPAFRVTLDRLTRYGRAFDLLLDGVPVAAAVSAPEASGDAQHLVFPLQQPLPFGLAMAVVERLFGIVAPAGTVDVPLLLAAMAARLAGLEADLAALRYDNAALRSRLDTALDLGRDRLMLERLDLFYLLLCERLGAVDPTIRPEPEVLPEPPTTQRFGVADVDGIGIFDSETDGHSTWRWFGPEATIALRGLAGLSRRAGPACRVVLLFHRFAGPGEPPAVRVSTGGPAESLPMRPLKGQYALDVPVARSALVGGDMLVLHLSFDRHHASAADVRLLSAAFSGAEIMFGPG